MPECPVLDEVSVLFIVVFWVSWVGSVSSIFINSLAVCWAVSLVRWIPSDLSKRLMG